MKNIIVPFTALFLCVTSLFCFAQQPVDNIQVTQNAKDVAGLLKICPINETSSAPFSGKEKLTEKAILKAKQTALAKGANIVYVQTVNYKSETLNSVAVIGAAYLSKTIKENAAVNAAVDNESCDDVKRELKLYKEKYGDLRTTQSTIVNNLDNGVDFNLLSVEGDKLSQTVTISFYLFTRKPNQSVSISGKGYGNSNMSKATDNDGNQYSAKLASLGDKQGEYEAGNKLSTEVKLKGFVKLSNVLSSTKEFSIVSIYMASANFDGGENGARGTVDLKNVEISWK